MKRTLLSIAIFIAASTASAEPWTYRGTLNDGGKPANGSYDLRVTLLNGAKTASVSGPVTLYGVKVVNGNFAADVDFGIDLSRAPAMALKTEVATAGSGGFVALGEATRFDPKAALAGVCWDTEGNAGTSPATNFIGTTDAQPFVVRTQNVQSLRIEPSTVLFNGTPITANVIAGSSANSVTAGVRGATIAGGGVTPSGDTTFVSSGPNRVTDAYGTVGGGYLNVAGNDTGDILDGAFATVSGGKRNTASGYNSTVSGGISNTASGQSSIVSGGQDNTASALVSTVSGGYANTASGGYSTVSGGSSNCAGGDFSWAAGRRAKIRPGGTAPLTGTCQGLTSGPGDLQQDGDNGTFIWADDQNADFISTGERQFLVRAQGGVGINGTPPDANTEFSVFGRAGDPFGGFVEFRLTPTPALNGNTGEGIELGVGPGGAGGNDASFRIVHRSNTLYAERMTLNSDGSVVIRSNITGSNTGVTMAANAGAWSSLSDRRLKQGIVPVDASAILDQVVRLPMATWSYIAQGSGVRHIGPMAQDFAASFKVGENDTTISTIDADGVALAAIQGLNAKLESENAAMRLENKALQARLEAIEARLESR